MSDIITDDDIAEFGDDDVDVWFQSSNDVGTTQIVLLSPVDGAAIRTEVTYANVDGEAMLEGCISLGTIEEVENANTEIKAMDAQAIVQKGNKFRWPKGILTYEFAPGFSSEKRVKRAMKHWEQNTDIRFQEGRNSDGDYVLFQNGAGCSSRVGRIGGRQEIKLHNPGCGIGAIIHEIGHALGLWHEQSRSDRDEFITIRAENIKDDRIFNFSKQADHGIDFGPYDYGSIMHYPRDAFSKNFEDTIVPKDRKARIGQRKGLSEGDIRAIQAIYNNEFAKR